MNRFKTNGNESLRFLRPITFAALALGATLLAPKGLKGDEPRHGAQDSRPVVTVAQGGPVSTGTPQPKERNNVETSKVSFYSEGEVGRIHSILLKADNANVEVRDKHDKVVPTEKVGNRVVFITNETGVYDVSVDGQDIGSVWIRGVGSLAPTEEENGMESAYHAVKLLMGRGMSCEKATEEVNADIIITRAVNALVNGGRADLAKELGQMYDNDKNSMELLGQLYAWGYKDFAVSETELNTLRRLYIGVSARTERSIGCFEQR